MTTINPNSMFARAALALSQSLDRIPRRTDTVPTTERGDSYETSTTTGPTLPGLLGLRMERGTPSDGRLTEPERVEAVPSDPGRVIEGTLPTTGPMDRVPAGFDVRDYVTGNLLGQTGANVRFGPVTSYSPTLNEITLDPADRDSYLDRGIGGVRDGTHEAIHAAQGNVEPTDFETREAFVDAMVQREAEAQTYEILAAQEDGREAILQDEYEAAYQEAYDSALDDGLSSVDAASSGRQAGRNRIVDAFHNEEISSSLGVSHVDAYGDWWDRANTPAPEPEPEPAPEPEPRPVMPEREPSDRDDRDWSANDAIGADGEVYGP